MSSLGTAGDDFSGLAAISADGRFVAFRSFASTLVPGDTHGAADVFVRDRLTGTTERVSVDSRERVAFSSDADNLVPGEPQDSASDVYLRDVQAGTTEGISTASTGPADADHDPGQRAHRRHRDRLRARTVLNAALSADGQVVAFESEGSWYPRTAASRWTSTSTSSRNPGRPARWLDGGRRDGGARCGRPGWPRQHRAERLPPLGHGVERPADGHASSARTRQDYLPGHVG
ncbi:MAG: hypothetical protein ACJ768_08600 [Gaiellaceae bacterium]